MEAEVGGSAAMERVETGVVTVGTDDAGGDQKGEITMFSTTHLGRARRVLGAFAFEQMERMFNAMESVFQRGHVSDGK